MTFEYLRCEEFIEKAIAAFYDDPIWNKYLSESKKGYVTPPYDHIRQRIAQAGVFQELDRLFAPLGYTLQLSSFEKLAVLKVKEFGCSRALKEDRIALEREIPMPLMLYFKVERD